MSRTKGDGNVWILSQLSVCIPERMIEVWAERHGTERYRHSRWADSKPRRRVLRREVIEELEKVILDFADKNGFTIEIL